jgi:hypothetical protein
MANFPIWNWKEYLEAPILKVVTAAAAVVFAVAIIVNI